MNICRDAFNGYTAKLNKSTKYVVIETLFLFMVIPRKINFTQLSRYGNRCEQCYRQTFSKKFDWVQYNLNLMEKLFGKNDRKAIAIDPTIYPNRENILQISVTSGQVLQGRLKEVLKYLAWES